MTEEMINRHAQKLINGGKFIMLDRRWDYNPAGRGKLSIVGGGMLNAMPNNEAKEGQPEEYKNALEIIKTVERIKWASKGK
jgi:hypothetical protein